MWMWEVLIGIYYFIIEDFVKVIGGFDRFNEIGEGCFGKVYVGRFFDGWIFVIKWGGFVKYFLEEFDCG